MSPLSAAVAPTLRGRRVYLGSGGGAEERKHGPQPWRVTLPAQLGYLVSTGNGERGESVNHAHRVARRRIRGE